MPHHPTLLLVEDNLALAGSLVDVFAINGFKVTAVHRAGDGLRHLRFETPDLIILDVMLPDMDGFSFLKRLRKGADIEDEERRLIVSRIPVIMLTARSAKDDILMGLHEGADHYLTKPVDPDVLVAHVNIQLQRSRRNSEDVTPFLEGKLYPSANRLVLGDTVITLTPQECALLKVFASEPERTFSREELLKLGWGVDVPYETKTIDVHIYKIKRKIIKHGFENPFVAVRGKGYRLRSD